MGGRKAAAASSQPKKSRLAADIAVEAGGWPPKRTLRRLVKKAVEATLLAHGVTAGVEGYAVCHALALDNLRLGRAVVVDVVNPLRVTREGWADAALAAGVPLVNIEVLCSDTAVHRQRVEARRSDTAAHLGAWLPPTWEAVQASSQAFEPWHGERVTVETADRDERQAFVALLAALRPHGRPPTTPETHS